MNPFKRGASALAAVGLFASLASFAFAGPDATSAVNGPPVQIAQAPLQITPPPSQAAPAVVRTESIGTVATLTGGATVTRNNATTPLKLKDDIFSGDTLRTGASGALGITLDDETTFNMGANATMVMDNLVYQSGGANNAGLFNVVRGTVAFVAGQVAHTGDMKIATPTATLGIRGTTGVIEVPDNATAPGDVAIKLYNDSDGRLGRIEVFGVGPNAQQRLGVLERAATGFSIRPGAGGRFTALALQISPQQAARDRGFVGQLFRTHNVGRQLVVQRRNFRQQNLQRGPGQLRGPNNSRGPNNLRGPQNNLRQLPGPQRQNLRNGPPGVRPLPLPGAPRQGSGQGRRERNPFGPNR
jgi:hypothetical protein